MNSILTEFNFKSNNCMIKILIINLVSIKSESNQFKNIFTSFLEIWVRNSNDI